MKKPVIICVDDEKIVLDSIKKEIKATFKDMLSVEVAESGEEALELMNDLLEDNIEIPIVISDYVMPEMYGDEFLIRSKTLIPKTKRIMLTGQATTEGVGNAMINGGLYRFIEKPWNSEDMELTLTEAFKSYYKDKKIGIQETKLEELNRNLEERIEIKIKEISDKNEKIQSLLDSTVKGIIYTLVKMIAKSEDTLLSKSLRLRDNSKKLAEKMFPNNVWEIEIAALLSHLGCFHLDNDIKKRYFAGGILTQTENIKVRELIVESAGLLEKIPMFDLISNGISNMFYTTENINSESKNDTIPVISRILKLVNDYDNILISGKDKVVALNQLRNNNKSYDYNIFKNFEEIILNSEINEDDGIKKIPFRVKELKIGMKMADDLTDNHGKVIIRKNEEINQSNISLIIRLSRKDQIIEPIYIHNR